MGLTLPSPSWPRHALPFSRADRGDLAALDIDGLVAAAGLGHHDLAVQRAEEAAHRAETADRAEAARPEPGPRMPEPVPCLPSGRLLTGR